jgi:putative ABC transport system permease protein
VAARRREIAIRTAVGARRQDVLTLVLREGLKLVTVGLVVGIAASVILSRALNTFLFGVKPTDPLTLLGMGLLFAGVALLASWIPARRAAGVDPILALRYE